MQSMEWMGVYQPWYDVVEKTFIVRMVGSLYLVKKVRILLLVVED
jgi:hypothetical protein